MTEVEIPAHTTHFIYISKLAFSEAMNQMVKIAAKSTEVILKNRVKNDTMELSNIRMTQFPKRLIQKNIPALQQKYRGEEYDQNDIDYKFYHVYFVPCLKMPQAKVPQLWKGLIVWPQFYFVNAEIAPLIKKIVLPKPRNRNPKDIRIKKLHKEKNDLQIKLQKEIDQIQEILATKSEEINQFEIQIKSLNENRDQQDQQVHTLNNQLQEAHDQITTLKVNIQTLTDAKVDIQAKLDRTEREVSKLQDLQETLEILIRGEFQLAENALKNKLILVNGTNKFLKQRARAIKKDSADRIRNLQKDSNKLQKKVSKLKQKILRKKLQKDEHNEASMKEMELNKEILKLKEELKKFNEIKIEEEVPEIKIEEGEGQQEDEGYDGDDGEEELFNDEDIRTGNLEEALLDLEVGYTSKTILTTIRKRNIPANKDKDSETAQYFWTWNCKERGCRFKRVLRFERLKGSYRRLDEKKGWQRRTPIVMVVQRTHHHERIIFE